LAGAAGAIGKRLVPLLLDGGHHVVGTIRSTSNAFAMARTERPLMRCWTMSSSFIGSSIDGSGPSPC
jgi:nucleoside-diphosphate-sugar epimerase